MMRQFQTVKVVDTKCKTCGGPHSFTECPAVSGYTQETAYATTGNYNSGGSLPGNIVPNPRANLKAITTQTGVTLAGPSVSPPPSKESSPTSTSFSTISSSKMPEVTKDTVQPSTKNIQPSVAQTQILIYEPGVAPKPKPTIPYPSRVNKQKLPTTPVNENCSAVILKKLPEKLGDPDMFLIPCDFPEFYECLALANLGIDDTDLDLEGDIRLLEELLNNDPSLSPLPLNELNVEEIKTVKSSINEPSELELKELPSHLEYAFLEGTGKLPVIIFKELKDEEKSAHLKVLKSH
uniref:Reverse transcriptase domain-containing protein n=1 Tax=Tanacetum cinerariifolium TaxID=118510 RepID=A0A699JJB1_TANCI|nr:reverse transcriptase domain-containing protein [Tanacetum cinerariifolium]